MRSSSPLSAVSAALALSLAALVPIDASAQSRESPPAAVAPPQDVARVRSIAGVVRSYLVDEFGDVEGIIAGDGTQVRFPRHMGDDVVRTLKPGDRFAADGDGAPGRTFRAYALGKAGEKRLVEARPTIDPAAAARDMRRASPEAMRVDGTIALLLRAPAGEVDAVVLDDGTVVRLPRRSGLLDAATLRIGARLVVEGYGTNGAHGRAVRAEQFALDGGAMIALQPRGPEAPRAVPPDDRAPPPPPPVRR